MIQQKRKARSNKRQTGKQTARWTEEWLKERSDDQKESLVIGDFSGRCKRDEGSTAALVPGDIRDAGGAYSDKPQTGCGDDSTGDSTENPITPDPWHPYQEKATCSLYSSYYKTIRNIGVVRRGNFQSSVFLLRNYWSNISGLYKV
jgi:hypothetical protein